MFLLTKPRITSQWIDTTLDIKYTVTGYKGDDEVLVICHGQAKDWPDAMPLECFLTELKECK
jgi:hypothetical protein